MSALTSLPDVYDVLLGPADHVYVYAHTHVADVCSMCVLKEEKWNK